MLRWTNARRAENRARTDFRLVVRAKRQASRGQKEEKKNKKEKREKKKKQIPSQNQQINRQNRPWKHSDCSSRNSCRIARYPATTRSSPDSWIAGTANNGRYRNWNPPRWGLWRRRKRFLYCRRRIAVGLGQKANSLCVVLYFGRDRLVGGGGGMNGTRGKDSANRTGCFRPERIFAPVGGGRVDGSWFRVRRILCSNSCSSDSN